MHERGGVPQLDVYRGMLAKLQFLPSFQYLLQLYSKNLTIVLE